MPNFDGFVGEAYQAPSIYQDAQELINWYPEIDKAKPQGARGVMALYPTPGLTVQIVPGVVGEVRGLYVLAGGATMLAVVGNTAYSISSSFVATVIGTLGTNTGLVYITDNRVAAMFGDGVNRYSYTFSGSGWSTLPTSDGAFTGADKVEYVDDFIVYNNPGTQQWAGPHARAYDDHLFPETAAHLSERTGVAIGAGPARSGDKGGGYDPLPRLPCPPELVPRFRALLLLLLNPRSRCFPLCPLW